MARNKGKTQRIYVVGSGYRGTHGCTERFVVEGTLRHLKGNIYYDVEVEGMIVDVHPCEFCGTTEKIGDYVKWRGWIDPEYYGHDGVQL